MEQSYTDHHVGEAIKSLRKDQNLSQQRLAEICGLTQGAISQIEAGTRLPGFESIQKIAISLNISADKLIGNSSISPEDAAIQALIAKIKQRKMSAGSIRALTQFVGTLPHADRSS